MGLQSTMDSARGGGGGVLGLGTYGEVLLENLKSYPVPDTVHEECKEYPFKCLLLVESSVSHLYAVHIEN